MNSRRLFLKRSALFAGCSVLPESLWAADPPKELTLTGKDGMRILLASQRSTVADEPGIYHHSAGVVSTPDGLVCVYRTSDQHVASWVNVNMARSGDGGRTWYGHRVLAESSFAKDKANWIAPQTSLIPDGRIFVIMDRGVKKSPFDWPMLSQWQMPDRGMSNYLLVSADNGKTWAPPRKIDNIGGEPSYIIGLSNGSLMYTRTDSAPTAAKKNPALPWGATYYRSTAVFSDDGGKTFNRTAPIFDDPLIGDCEVGIVEYAPGKVMALSRVGDGGSQFNQPSRIAYSEDFGRTWSKPVLSPIYAHRPRLGQLKLVAGSKAEFDGPLFVTFRNADNGTNGTMAWCFQPHHDYGYQPNNFIWQEDCCQLSDGVLEIRTAEGTQNAVEFSLYPTEDEDSSCEFEATLAVKDADTYGCNICCGAWIRLEPNRVSLADRPSTGFAIDATQFHDYRIVFADHRLTILVDGQQRLESPIEGIFNRNNRFGNRRGAIPNPPHLGGQPFRPDGGGYTKNRSHNVLKAIRFSVKNRRDYSVEWNWQARSGKYPDQFRRDNLIIVERNGSFAEANGGYSGWTQTPDDTIVIVDYTCTAKNLPVPILRAYRLSPSTLGKP